MAKSKYSGIFQPIVIGGLKIKNRVAMAPMGIIGLITPEGTFSHRAVDYYAERATGGAGLIITSMVRIENQIEKGSSALNVSANPARFIQAASELTQAVHAHGARIFIQLTGGVGRVARPGTLQSRPVAPSAVPYYWDPSVTCRELEIEEVEALVRAFGNASNIAVAAGFDGAEIHAMHEGYLIDQFTMGMFNRRTDRYGGDLRGRLTLPIEILKEIKKAAGLGFPVVLRYGIKSFIKDWGQGGLPGEEFKEAGRDTAEGLEAARILQEAGYDAFDADAGSYDAWYWAHPPLYMEHGCYLPLTEKLKKVVTVPVIVAGRMELPELAASALAGGKADIVALGRGLLAEPHWANKVREGRADRIRPCLGCHDGCFLQISLGRPISCAVNPACGRERDYSLQPARERKRVVVCGGGIAGMEAARVAAARGHRVVLYEKTDKLGGHLIEASVPPFKSDVARLLGWYEAELAERGVDVRSGKEVTPELALEGKPGAVIVATGSTYAIPKALAGNGERVATATELLLGKKQVKEPVVIVGGGLTGCETALWLAQQGRHVTIVEMLDGLMQSGAPVFHANKMMLLDLLRFHNVQVLTGITISGVAGDGVELTDKHLHKTRISAGTVVIATGLQPDRTLFSSLGGQIPNACLIGDAKEPRNIMHAVWDAYEAARSI